MIQPLTFERFQELADVYGGVIARWPDAVREEARIMALEPRCAALLASASALDQALDSWAVEPASPAARERAVAALPASRRGLGVRARLWWAGLGLAAALAGAAAGAATVAILPPMDAPPGGATSFGDVNAQEG
jgi:hypothetical protein